MPKKERGAKSGKVESAGVIDLSSNELRLKIAQYGKGKLKYLESLSYPISLGRDTFNSGKISFEKVEKTCDIIKNFLIVAAENGVTNMKVVATTAVREATNSDYILDQVKIKTGINVRVLDDTEEKLYIYKLMNYLLTDELKQSAMMVYIGSGNIGVSIEENGKIPFMQNIKIGSLRISELFEDIQDYSSEFYKVLEEYLSSFTDMLSGSIPVDIQNFIVSGSEIEMIAKLLQAKKDGVFYTIGKEKFLKLYDDIKYKTVDRIMLDYDISAEKAEVLLPAMCIYYNLLALTQANSIVAMQVLLPDSVIYEMLYPEEFGAINKSFDKNTILSARALAKKYCVVEDHYRCVEGFATKIFDKMKKVHGLSSREKLLLQTAAIVHDCGKYVNILSHYRHTYNIIKGSDIVGLNLLDREIVAGICLYHSRIVPTADDKNYSALDMATRVLISKLAAILRLADALDRSHTQKFDDIDVKVTEDELIIGIVSDKNTDLEQWSFNDKGVFFEEVFGIKATIRKKKVV